MTNYQVTHLKAFKPALRFLVALTVVAFFYSWEPRVLVTAAPVPSKPISAKKLMPDWKYVRIKSEDAAKSTAASH